VRFRAMGKIPQGRRQSVLIQGESKPDRNQRRYNNYGYGLGQKHKRVEYASKQLEAAHEQRKQDCKHQPSIKPSTVSVMVTIEW